MRGSELVHLSNSPGWVNGALSLQGTFPTGPTSTKLNAYLWLCFQPCLHQTTSINTTTVITGCSIVCSRCLQGVIPNTSSQYSKVSNASHISYFADSHSVMLSLLHMRKLEATKQCGRQNHFFCHLRPQEEVAQLLNAFLFSCKQKE